MDSGDLLNLSNWVHHYPHILSQGRCTYFTPKKEDDEEEEEEEEEMIENGPKLLTEISQDKGIGNRDAWTARLSSRVNNKFTHAILRNNRWPGAYAYAKDD